MMLTKKWAIRSLLVAMVAVSGCSSFAKPHPPDPEPQSQPAVALPAGPTPEATQPEDSPSAAAPGAEGRAILNADQLLDEAIAEVEMLDLSAEPATVQFRVQDPKNVFMCTYSPRRNRDEVQLMACRFGEFVNTVTGHALFWNAGDECKGSYYPQVSAEAARLRQTYFRALGENCPIGCAGGFQVLRQEGNHVLAVVDLSSVGTHGTDEVHLLERDQQNEAWRILWVPTPDVYRFKDWPKVTLPDKGIEQFTVAYRAGGQDTWVLDGTTFVRR